MQRKAAAVVDARQGTDEVLALEDAIRKVELEATFAPADTG